MKRLLVIAAVFIASPAGAEIYFCDGKWTNKRCRGKVERRIKEVVGHPRGRSRSIGQPVKRAAAPAGELLAPAADEDWRLVKQFEEDLRRTVEEMRKHRGTKKAER